MQAKIPNSGVGCWVVRAWTKLECSWLLKVAMDTNCQSKFDLRWTCLFHRHSVSFTERVCFTENMWKGEKQWDGEREIVKVQEMGGVRKHNNEDKKNNLRWDIEEVKEMESAERENANERKRWRLEEWKWKSKTLTDYCLKGDVWMDGG